MNSSPKPLSIAAKNSRVPTADPARGFPSESDNQAAAQAGGGGVRDGWKRMLDITCIVLASPGVLLLTGVIAMGIKLVSPGPVFFKQERIGRGRNRFVCWKFRTMKVGTDPLPHQRHLKQLLVSGAPMTKMDAAGDPRLIRYGNLLRATGLDELPQLFNVLRGEMSLVGPRPCTAYELESYLPWQFARFEALPGLTGLWQVSGKNRTTFTEMINLDINYAKNKSLWMDLKIMAATFSMLASQVKQARPARAQCHGQQQVS